MRSWDFCLTTSNIGSPHAVRDPNGRAYSRTAHLPERRKMMQAWADYLDQLKVKAPNGCGSRDAASAGRMCSGMEAACRARRWASANIGGPERLSDVHLTLKLRLLTLRLYLSSRQKKKGVRATMKRTICAAVGLFTVFSVPCSAGVRQDYLSNVCFSRFNQMAQPANFPGRVVRIKWDYGELSATTPFVEGNWTVRFPQGAYPIARMAAYSTYNPVVRSPMTSYWIYVTGLQCANAVSGTHTCSLVLHEVLAPDVPLDAFKVNNLIQAYFLMGTPYKAANGSLYQYQPNNQPMQTIGYAGCPGEIDYAR